jgi:hypothetical protein
LLTPTEFKSKPHQKQEAVEMLISHYLVMCFSIAGVDYFQLAVLLSLVFGPEENLD